MDLRIISLIFVVFMFGLGIVGVMSARKNLILVFMSIELMLMGVVLGFAFNSMLLEDVMYQFVVLTLLVLGGAEASIALAVLVVYYRLSGHLDFNLISLCKG